MWKWSYAAVFVIALGLIAMSAGCKKKQVRDDACGASAGCSADGCGAGGCGTDGCGAGGCGTDGCGADGCGAGGKASSADAKHAQMVMKQYRNWRKANAEAFLSKQHARHRIYDYVNALASRPFDDGSGTYKPGSVIVKEGWKQGKRSMVWIMEKRGSGYDKEHGDWWYATLSASGKVMNAGKVAMCVNCHDGADNDYVFGLPK